jgi:hypothetical protein
MAVNDRAGFRAIAGGEAAPFEPVLGVGAMSFELMPAPCMVTPSSRKRSTSGVDRREVASLHQVKA